MNLTGKITGVSANYLTKKYELTVSVNEPENLTSGYEKLKDAELLDIKVTKHRKRRSLDANAYFHVLVGKIADELRISKQRCKNIMIGRYGQPFYIESGAEAVIKTNIPVDDMMENESVHCMPCSQKSEKGKEVIFYKIYRGSSTYDTREMSILIDGTVEECKNLGIETLTPDELERMKSAWKA